jgi:uncharacterized protein (TIGR03663 family)
MPDQIRHDPDEWRLGFETAAHPQPELKQPPDARPRDPGDDRLDTPLYVVTAEHLGWTIISLYALITRLAALGLRPLSSDEAARALFTRDIAHRGLSALAANPQIGSGWIDPLRALCFVALGASDYSARLVAAIFGLMLVGTAFAMRRHLGRAGALAFAAVLTLSPTVTYFSRCASPAIPAVTLIVIAVAIVFALVGNTDTGKVAGLAVAIALTLSADAIVTPVAAMFIAILILFGIWELLVGRNPMIRFRVWWERRSAQLAFGAAIAIGLFFAFESGFGRRSFLVSILAGALRAWLPAVHPDFRGGLDFYLPALGLYEFSIVIFATLGAIGLLVMQIRTRMAAVAFLWTILSAVFFLADPVHRPSWLVMMIVPAALLAAAAIDWIHRTDAWVLIRYPLAMLALLTIYVQVTANFVRVAPDSSEASWSRHMLLFWSDPATSAVARQEFSHAESAVAGRGSVFFVDQHPVAMWYLRDLPIVDDIANAQVIVSPTIQPKESNIAESSDFTIEEQWTPHLAGLNARSALRYFIAQRAWSEVSGNDVRVDVRSQTPAAAAPAPIATPTAMPTTLISPTAAATESSTPSASASETPTPAETLSPSPTVEASPEPTP